MYCTYSMYDTFARVLILLLHPATYIFVFAGPEFPVYPACAESGLHRSHHLHVAQCALLHQVSSKLNYMG